MESHHFSYVTVAPAQDHWKWCDKHHKVHHHEME